MFVISGRFVTDHARDRVFEFSWEDGLRFLCENMHGPQYTDFVDVLAGRKQFTGDSKTGVGLADEDAGVREEVEARYRWTYAGAWYDRSTKKTWVPYAFVRSFSRDDMVEQRVPNRYIPCPRGRMVSELCGGVMKQWGMYRCVAYMDDVVEDRVVNVHVPGLGGQAVLWKEMRTSVPLWWKQLGTAELAIVEWVREHGLPEERGASPSLRGPKPLTLNSLMSLPPGVTEVEVPVREDAAMAMPPGPPLPAEEDRLNKKDSFWKALMPEGMPDEVADGLARSLSDTGDYPEPKPAKDLTTVKWAWVDKTGKVWPARGYMDHIPLAHALAEKFNLTSAAAGDNAERVLEVHGWVKVGHNNGGRPYASRSKKRTAKQRDIIFDWLTAHGADDDQIKRWVEDNDGFDY